MDAAGEFWAWARHRRRRFRVEGVSMTPTLAAGQFVLIDERRRPTPGDVVVANHPSKPISMIKRVASVSPEGLLELASDNPDEGSDSRSFGRVEPERLIGVATVLLEWPFPFLKEEVKGSATDRG